MRGELSFNIRNRRKKSVHSYTYKHLFVSPDERRRNKTQAQCSKACLGDPNFFPSFGSVCPITHPFGKIKARTCGYNVTPKIPGNDIPAGIVEGNRLCLMEPCIPIFMLDGSMCMIWRHHRARRDSKALAWVVVGVLRVITITRRGSGAVEIVELVRREKRGV